MHRKTIANGIACLVISLAGIGTAYADITAVAGPSSSLGTLPAIIAAPSDVLDGCVTNSGQEGFNEAQGVFTPAAFLADDGMTIPAGTLVDSHMIFFNQTGTVLATHLGVTWTFRRPIIAVMSDSGGTLEAASTFALGAPGTNYTVSHGTCIGAAPFTNRGLETTLPSPPFTHTSCPTGPANDCYSVSGNTITLGSGAAQPGDWIRIVTEGARLNVAIDIKPGSDPNCININDHGVIPVAILGSATFDVTRINTSSLNFAGLSVRLRGNGTPQCSISDTNRDGFNDMVCQFVDNSSNWSPGTTTATLTGLLTSGQPFQGSDTICLVP